MTGNLWQRLAGPKGRRQFTERTEPPIGSSLITSLPKNSMKKMAFQNELQGTQNQVFDAFTLSAKTVYIKPMAVSIPAGH